MKLYYINILNNYQTIFNHYWTSIELLSNVYQTIIKPINIYRTSIESLSNIYQTTIVPLLNIYRTSIEPHQTSMILNYREVNETLNIYQILIISIIYL